MQKFACPPAKISMVHYIVIFLVLSMGFALWKRRKKARKEGAVRQCASPRENRRGGCSKAFPQGKAWESVQSSQLRQCIADGHAVSLQRDGQQIPAGDRVDVERKQLFPAPAVKRGRDEFRADLRLR